MHNTVFFGPAVVDIHVKILAAVWRSLTRFWPAKLDAWFNIQLGGAICHAAAAYQLVAGDHPLAVPLVAADVLGNVVEELLSKKFDVRRANVADATRLSLILPQPTNPGATTAITCRPNITLTAAHDSVAPYLAHARSLFLGSFEARHTELLERILDMFTGTTYLMVTRSQLQDRERTRALLKRVTYVQMNAAELRDFTGKASIIEGIASLRAEGCQSIIVTDGPYGVVAYAAGRWWYASSLAVELVSDIGGGDTVGGAILGGVARGRDFGDVLRCAMAVAAKKVSHASTYGTWEELRQFYHTTPHLPPRPAKRTLAIEHVVAAAMSHPIMTTAIGSTAALIALIGAAYGSVFVGV
ncbi:MAG: carbohydrate kinase family protein [Pirellulales bacterium]